MPKFVHLHTHSHYSLLSALPKIDELVGKAKKCGMDALALTDNGNLYGALEFYKTCNKEGIKPIIGIDCYIAARLRTDKQTGIDNRRTRLVILAKNLEGYKNLLKLSTRTHLEGFYYKPRADKELLAELSSGLIAIIPAGNSALRSALESTDEAKAKEELDWYKKTYGNENVFIEITRHHEIEGHEKIMRTLIGFAKETNTPVVAGHDVYYLEQEERIAQETLVKVNSH